MDKKELDKVMKRFSAWKKDDLLDLIYLLEQQVMKLEDTEQEQEKLSDDNEDGKLVYKYIRCGKENCQCRNGYPHGRYIYKMLYDTDTKKTKYVYIGKEK